MNESHSRVLTLSHLLKTCSLPNADIVIHLLGCDEEDLIDLDLLSQHLSPGVEHLRLYLIGPHMQPCRTQLSSKPGRSLVIDMFGIKGLYHEIDLTDVPSPHYICIFNGGVWGYESWKPTIRCLSRLSRAFLLVTSYTLEEAEDDYDSLVEYLTPSAECIWEPKVNPNRSSILLNRSTQPEGRQYFDNFAFQCFRC